jgi:hypothetical protein
MTNDFVLAAIWEFASFAAGAAIGMVIAVAVSIHLEQRRGSLQGGAPGHFTAGARHINGFNKRDAKAAWPLANR